MTLPRKGLKKYDYNIDMTTLPKKGLKTRPYNIGMEKRYLTLNRPGGGGIRPQAGSCLCCAETVSSRKLKLSDFYYILIGLNSEYKPVPWDIHCCHGNAIVEGCSVKFWRKSVENCIFLLKSFSNLSLGLLFVISISKLPPMPNFKQIGLKTKKLGFSTFFQPNRA